MQIDRNFVCPSDVETVVPFIKLFAPSGRPRHYSFLG